jgi:regulator of sigma E protease
MEIIFAIIFIFSLLILIILHEFGHFIFAKKFGVKVEEFGVGLPPRIFGKKIGETVYSLNLLPLGGFVKILGEEERIDDPRSFNKKPIWQRASILLAGCLSFWIISAILLSVVMNLGVPRAVSDDFNQSSLLPRVQVIAVASGSPAEAAGLRAGDTIKELIIDGSKFEIQKVKEIVDLTEVNKGKEVILTIERGKGVFKANLIPRISPPEGEGPMGVALIRTIIESYPWYQTPFKGISATGNLTVLVVQGWFGALENLFRGLPIGVEIIGPIRATKEAAKIGQLGVNYFLQFIAMVAVSVGLFNLLPIPALDGGRLLFLVIEKIKKEPIPQRLEQKINSFFFILLIALIILVGVKEAISLF